MQIHTDTIRTAYSVEGPKTAPVVLLSHCLAGNRDLWRPQVEALRKDYQVVCYDIRGHGESEVVPAPYAMSDLAQDVIGLLDALGLERVHFVGLSLGGMIGQVLGASFPERFRTMALCDTTDAIPAAGALEWDKRAETARINGMAPLAEANLERWLSGTFRSQYPEETQRIRDMVESTPVEGFAGCCMAIRHFAMTEALPDIAVPTLLLHGEQDALMPREKAEAMQRRLPRAKVATIRDALHLSNTEQPEAFNRELLTFWDGCD
ncbi:MAG: alpha/beta fold hydrolase [Thermodesulfobacteriota bacterium]